MEKPLWIEASFSISFPELTMFLPGMIESDLITIYSDRTIELYEFKSRLSDLLEIGSKYIEIYPGSAFIKFCIKDDEKIESNSLNINTGRIYRIEECLKEIIGNSEPDMEVKNLENLLIKTVFLEYIFESLNNWLNLVLLYYAPSSLRILTKNYLEIPFINAKNNKNSGSLLFMAKKFASIKYRLIKYIKYVETYDHESKDFKKEIIDLHRKMESFDPKTVYCKDCINCLSSDLQCERLILLIPTLRSLKKVIERRINTIIELFNPKRIEYIATEKSYNDAEYILQNKSNKSPIRHIVDFNKPEYDIKDLDPARDCIIIIPEFPKHMLIDFLDYLKDKDENLFKKVFVLVPKRQLSDKAIFRKDKNGKVIDINNRYSNQFYLLMNLSDILNEVNKW